jgi:hypothetical protein
MLGLSDLLALISAGFREGKKSKMHQPTSTLHVNTWEFFHSRLNTPTLLAPMYRLSFRVIYRIYERVVEINAANHCK